MGDELSTTLREKRLYNVYFSSLTPSSDDPEDDYYDEIVIYDGGGVEGYGETKKN